MRRFIFILLGLVFLAICAVVFTDRFMRMGNPGGQYTVAGVIWIGLHFVIAAALVGRSGAYGAGYVMLTAIGATLALAAATGIVAVFVGIGWETSSHINTPERIILVSSLFGFLASVALLVAAGRLILLVWRREGFIRVAFGGALAILSASFLTRLFR